MTGKLMTGISFAALLAATAPAAASGEDRTPSQDEFIPIQRYNISYDEKRDIAEFYIDRYGFRTRDAEFRELDHPEDPNLRVLLVTFDGIRDDAVSGVQFRLVMRPDEGHWQVVEAGMRRKCHRGADQGQWTRDVCP